jgi:RNA polymerase sigma-70 factor (sigma-E family)
MGADPTFDAYVRSRTHALLRTAYLLTGDQHLAEDLVQMALIRTHRAWDRVRDGHPEAYTRKVMYHLQVSWWRRNRVPETLSREPPEHAGGRRPDDAVVDHLALRDALMRLAPKQRAVLVLRYFEDRTEAEAADLLGVSVGTVKSQAARALARLREVAPELLRGDAPRTVNQ